MALDLVRLQDAAVAKGFSTRLPGPGRLAVELSGGLDLIFRNAPDGDEVVGLDKTPWHFHPPWVTSVGHNDRREFSCDALLELIFDGDALVVELWESGQVSDRWLVHRGAEISMKFVRPGEEHRIRVV